MAVASETSTTSHSTALAPDACKPLHILQLETPAQAPVMMTVRTERFAQRTSDLSMIEFVRPNRLGVDNGNAFR
jgi:hypothetical protein